MYGQAKRILHGKALACFAVFFLWAWTPPMFSLAESPAELYKMKCAACHGVTGGGDTTLGKNLKLRALSAPEVQNQSNEELFAVISRGRNKMPAYHARLSAEQIRGLVQHLRSFRK